jgi:hypothetical protein
VPLQLFSQVIDVPSRLYADALVHELTDISAVMPLYALKSQINLFATHATAVAAEDGVQRVIAAYTISFKLLPPRAARTW